MSNPSDNPPENPPAFPRPASPNPNADNCQDGMMLRDYFAAKAMQAELSTPDPDVANEYGSDLALAKMAVWAYRAADAMLAARTSK